MHKSLSKIRLLPFFIGTLGILGGLTLGQLSTEAVSQFATLNAGEWTSEIPALDTTPTCDEPPAGSYTCEDRSQEHEYILNSINTATAEYWTTVHAFAIVLDTTYNAASMPEGPGNPSTNDFLENVDTQNLLCTIGDSTYHACGFDADNDLGQVIASRTSGGVQTTVTYQTLDFLPG